MNLVHQKEIIIIFLFNIEMYPLEKIIIKVVDNNTQNRALCLNQQTIKVKGSIKKLQELIHLHINNKIIDNITLNKIVRPIKN